MGGVEAPSWVGCGHEEADGGIAFDKRRAPWIALMMWN